MNGARVAILGAGSIGVAFSIVFGLGGARVRLWDPFPAARERAITEFRSRIEVLAREGFWEGAVEDVAARVEVVSELRDAVSEADLVQECVPEDGALKRALFAEISELVGDTAVLASSSSAIVPSELAAGYPRAAQMIVGHPGNPPYLIPVIEVVRAPETSDAIVERATELYRSAGLSPVVVRREAEGFIFNRLQGAVLREAYCLVRDGVATVEDIDTVMSKGLGRRWAFIGPFETVDLNTRGGIASHASKMGPAYARMGAERGQHDPWTDDLVDLVAEQRRALLPERDWAERVLWRDRQLMRFRREFDGPGSAAGE
ncbi:3-hydroxyacyl-CoA dehydrogenase [Leucobacter chromiireducens]|uniref:3-hydroxyacyl-CoA dehydrogenase n=1 Tax=Leucobacter chromiireducens subsp. solipictus TaxID=398235 RepID=A0ABS1SIQ0_9MICO|nr:3-hydroxyacyl-CoA dehydrogenase [Leucobacter chromiireducens subsp. solipictus]